MFSVSCNAEGHLLSVSVKGHLTPVNKISSNIQYCKRLSVNEVNCNVTIVKGHLSIK